MMLLLLKAVLSASLIGNCVCTRILVMCPTGTKSHKLALIPLVEELANRGHDIIIVSPFLPVLNHPKIQDIFLTNLAKEMEETPPDYFSMQKKGLTRVFSVLDEVGNLAKTAYQEIMANEEFKLILNERKIDLVIIDMALNDFCYAISDFFGAPFVLHSSAIAYARHFLAHGGSVDYATIPSKLTSFDNEMSFSQRLANLIAYQILEPLIKTAISYKMEPLIKRDFPNSRPINELEREMSLFIAISDPTISWPRSLPPSVITITGVHTRPAQQLPEPFSAFVDEAKKGFIVFTLGSHIPISELPEETLNVFLKVFARVPQRVVMKWETEIPMDFPSNILASKWLPQQDLLGHPNAKLFISHCGSGGYQESVYHGLPILCLPLFGDQFVIAAKGKNQGNGLVIDWSNINEEILHEAVKRLINDQSFKDNVSKASLIMRDVLMPSKDIAAYWIEHVLRHGGSKHLQLASKNIPFYKLFLLDIAVFLLIVLVLFLVILYFSFPLFISKCFQQRSIIRRKVD